MWENPKVIAALIAAITSVITILISSLIKSIYERRFHVFKLEAEHRYEQRKRIKEILSKNKIRLLNSFESLNHRLWNFSNNYKEKWHCVENEYTNKSNYYFISFVFRVLCVYAWIKKIEDEMVYLDTTIASREDMEFMKFLRLFPEVLCDLVLTDGFEYDPFNETDHFFKNSLEHMAAVLIKDEEVCSFSKFQENLEHIIPELKSICRFIDCMSPDEDRYRWDRLQILHLALMGFLNAYGYDFQVTSEGKLNKIIATPRKSRLLENFIRLLERDKLSRQKQIKSLIKLIQKHSG